MASNQKKNEQRAKQKEKERKTKKIVTVVLLILVVALLVMKLCEVDYTSVKNHFVDENGKFSLVGGISDEDNFPLTMENGDNVVLGTVGSKLEILNSTSVMVVNPANANVAFEADHGYANPIMKTSGDYSIIFDQGAYKYRLDSSNENVYEDTTKNAILTADVTNNGTVVLATTSDNSKSKVVVYNKSLVEKFTYENSDGGCITSIAVDNGGNRIAFATVNSKNGKFVTTVYTINVGDEKPRKSFTYENSSVIDLHYSSSSLYIVGTDFVSLVTSQKNEKKVFESGKLSTSAFSYTPSDELVVSYAEYTTSTTNRIAYVQSNGKVKSDIDTGLAVKAISASNTEMSVLTSDSIISYSLSKGEQKKTYSIDDSYRTIHQMSSKIFAKHQSLIELYSNGR